VSARVATCLLGGVLAVAGCDSWDPSIRARQAAAETFACESAEVTQTEENRWHAVGCGHEGDFACTSGALEPTCIQVRSAGGERPVEEDEPAADTRSVAESEAALYAQAAREDPDLDPGADESAAEAEEAPSAAERVIRAGLDAHRADIVACTQRDPTVLRVSYTSDGELDVHLSGGLEGSPEEGCVRAALSGARAPEGESGTVLHLVHGG
jgi:hypothetical protein